MVIITNLAGESLPINNVNKVDRTRDTNGNHQINLIVKRTKRNYKAFDLIEHEGFITIANNRYRIKELGKQTLANSVELEITALHEFYDNVDVYQYDVLSGVRMLSLHKALTHALNGTGYTFIIKGDFASKQFEDFGNDNAIKLFNYAKERFDFEFTIDNRHLTIVKRIGNQTNHQLRWKHNIKTIKQHDNTNNLSTYIKGFGKPKEDDEGNPIEGEYVVTAEYKSPNAKKYGIRHAEPIYDERFIYKEPLLEKMKESLIDYPEIEFEIEYEQLAKNINTKLENLDLGDSVYLIHEPMKLTFDIRIVEVVDNPINKNIKPKFVLSTIAGRNLSSQAIQHIQKENRQKEIDFIKGKQNHFDRRIEETIEAVSDVENAMIHVDEEMQRIKNEVIPEIEQAVDSTRIPSFVEPPFPIPQSNLYWDSSVIPPRLMRWNGEEWGVLVPTEQEIDNLIEQMKQEAIRQGIDYTDDEIRVARQAIIARLEGEINDVNSQITDLNDVKDNLIERANNADERLNNAEQAIQAKVSSIDYERDKTGILSNIERNETDIQLLSDGLALTVTKEEFNTAKNNLDERINSTETTLGIHAGLVEAKAEKEELTNYIDKQTYNNKISSLDVSIEGINQTVSNIETDVDTVDGRVSSALSQISSVDQKADGIISSVSELRGEFENLGTGNNLVPNSSFEKDHAGWGSGGTIVNGGHSGSKSLRVSSKSGTSSKSLKEKIPVIPGNTYEFSYWYKTSSDANGTSSNQKLRIGKADGSLLDATIGWTGAKTVWTKVSKTWKIPSGVTEIKVSLVNNHTKGWVQWDDISIVDVTNIAEVASSTETSIKQLFDQIKLRATETYVDGINNRLKTAESTLEVLPGQISAKVSKNGVIGAINASPESLTIDFSKVNINAVTEFAPMSKNYHATTSIASGTAGKWFRIASNTGNRAHGRFILKDTTSSQHGTAVFEAGINYGKNPYINLTSYGLYSSRSFTKARILYNSTYDTVYVDVYINNNARTQKLEYWITDNIQSSGWVGANWISATVPSGYSSFERTLNEDNVVQGTVDKWKYGNTTMINGGEIYTKTITASKLNVNEVFGNSAVIAKIQSDSVRTASLDAGKITTGTLNSNRIGSSSITAAKLASNSVTADKIAANAITAGKIATGAITADKISGGDFTGKTFTGGTFTGSRFISNSASKYTRMQIDNSTLTLHTGGTGITNWVTEISIDSNRIRMREKYADRRGEVWLTPVGFSFYRYSTPTQTSGGEYVGGMHFSDTDVTLQASEIEPPPEIVSNSDRLRIRHDKTLLDGSLEIENSGSAIKLRGQGGKHAFIEFYKGGSTRYGYVGISSDTNKTMTIRNSQDEVVLWGQSGSFRVGQDGTGGRVYSDTIYKRTYSSASNMYITSHGTIGRSTSARKYKLLEEPINFDPYAILELEPKTWYDKRAVDDLANHLNGWEEVEKQYVKRHAGLIADDVADVGLEMFVTYDEKGEIEGLEYDRLWVNLIPIIREQQQKVEKLEEQLEQLLA